MQQVKSSLPLPPKAALALKAAAGLSCSVHNLCMCTWLVCKSWSNTGLQLDCNADLLS